MLFQKLVGLYEVSAVVPRVSEVRARESDRFNKQTVCCCNCTFSNNVTKAEIEGVKLDLSILASRFVHTFPSMR